MSDLNASTNYYNTYVAWQQANNKNLTYYDVINANIANATNDNYTGLTDGSKSQETYESNLGIINTYEFTELAKYEDYREDLSTFDYTYGGTSIEAFDESRYTGIYSEEDQAILGGLNLLAQGHMNSADKDGNNLLSFGEYLAQDMANSNLEGIDIDTFNEAYNYITENIDSSSGYDSDSYIEALTELDLSDITSDETMQILIKTEYYEFIQFDKDKDTDGLSVE